MATGATQWETSTPAEPKAWTLANTIMAALGAIIIFLLTLGFYSQNNKIETGDKAIYDQIALGNKQTCDTLKDLKDQMSQFNAVMIRHSEDIATLKANQCARMEREKQELQLLNGGRKR